MQRGQTLAEKKKEIEAKRELQKSESIEDKDGQTKPKEGVLDGVRRTMKMGTMFKQRKLEIQAELFKMMEQQKVPQK